MLQCWGPSSPTPTPSTPKATSTSTTTAKPLPPVTLQPSKLCPEAASPVCASDGRLSKCYDNKCKAEKAGALICPEKGGQGQCDNFGKDTGPDEGSGAQVDKPCSCWGAPILPIEPPPILPIEPPILPIEPPILPIEPPINPTISVCPKIFIPVCGVDRKCYKNRCEAEERGTSVKCPAEARDCSVNRHSCKCREERRKDSICSGVDAMVETENGVTFAFRGDKNYQLSRLGGVEDGYPRNISQDWSGFPGLGQDWNGVKLSNNISAAVTWWESEKTTFTYFFAGDYHYKFKGHHVFIQDEVKFLCLRPFIIWSLHNLISEPPQQERLESGYPKLFFEWPGANLPPGVEAALQYPAVPNSPIFFFRGRRYWEYDIIKNITTGCNTNILRAR